MRRQSILDTAQHQLRSNGPRGVNARTIAKALGIRPSHVFYYFPTQRELLNGVVSYIVSINADFVQNEMKSAVGSSYLDRLMIYMAGNLKWGRQKPESVSVLLYGLTELESDKELGGFVSFALQSGQQKVFDIIAIGMGTAEFQSELSPQDLASTLHQLLVGCIIQQYFSQGTESLDSYLRRIESVIRSLIKVVD